MTTFRSRLEAARDALFSDHFIEAERLTREVLAAEPDHDLAMRLLGLALRGQGRLDESIDVLRTALARQPQNIHLMNDLGAALAKRRDHREAYFYLEAAAKVDPDLPGLMLNLGAILCEEGRHLEAIKATRRCLEHDPTNGLAHYNMGNSLREIKQLDEAVSHYEAALCYQPGFPRAIYNLAVCLLLQGRYGAAWPGYEMRGEVGEVVFDHYSQPRWDGSPLEGKSLVIHGEQGVGDEVLFASCVPDLIGRAERLSLVCDPRLGTLFTRSFPTVDVQPFARLSDRSPAPLSAPHDYQIASGSLPLMLRPDLASFPRRKSFLVPDAARVAFWRQRYASLGPGPKIGVSWRAGGKAVERLKRSMPLVEWAPILSAPGAFRQCAIWRRLARDSRCARAAWRGGARLGRRRPADRHG